MCFKSDMVMLCPVGVFVAVIDGCDVDADDVSLESDIWSDTCSHPPAPLVITGLV